MQELQQTIASLQRIKSGLEEETKEFRVMQVEKEPAPKDDRVLQLEKRIEESKAAAEKLLGFSLKPKHFDSGDVYSLMPSGYADRQRFEETVEKLREDIHTTEAILRERRAYLGKKEIEASQAHSRTLRTQLLTFLMAYQPMMDPTFSKTLATHLDAMLEAYLELRTLECAEAKA